MMDQSLGFQIALLYPINSRFPIYTSVTKGAERTSLPPLVNEFTLQTHLTLPMKALYIKEIR